MSDVKAVFSSNYMNYELTNALLNRKASSQHSLTAGFEKVGYVASAVFVGIYETFRNLATCPVKFAINSLNNKAALKAFDMVNYFIVLDELLGPDSPLSLQSLAKNLKSSETATEITISKEDQMTIREVMVKKGLKYEDVMAIVHSKGAQGG